MGMTGDSRVVSATLLMVAAASCGPPSPPPPPAPVMVPVIDAVSPALSLGVTDVVLPEPGPTVEDEILRSSMLRDAGFRQEVARWIEFWQTAGARWFPEYLSRMAWFSTTVDATLAERGLPPSLRYLPIVESGYSPRAVSRARAVGLWQLMAPTARGYGLHVGPLLDERRNPFRSTDVAVGYLASLRERFGSWFLALAAYNSGPYRVQSVLERHAPLAPRSDALYWQIRPHLPRETRDFVPKFVAASMVAANPAAYGFDRVPASHFVFDEVAVPDATTLDVIAEAAGVDQSEIERLNPEILRGITPPGRETSLRVPLGTGDTFRERYALIPPSERVTFVEHRVARGETFTHIARRYGVRLTDLRAANPGVEPRRLQIGQRLTVPVAGRRGTN